MKIDRVLVIDEIKLTRKSEAPCRILLKSLDGSMLKSTGQITMTQANFKEINRLLGSIVPGMEVICSLTSRSWGVDGQGDFEELRESIGDDELIITELGREERVSPRPASPEGKFKRTSNVTLRTITLELAPDRDKRGSYQFELALTDKEYGQFRKLPPLTAFKLDTCYKNWE